MGNLSPRIQAGLARRRRALPVALLVVVFGALSHVAFVPAPARGPLVADAVSQDRAPAALPAAVLLGLSAAGGPVLAAGADSPLAHGAEGVMDASTLEAIFEKCAFFGLAFSTFAAWWNGTLGSGRAEEQQLGGRPLPFWGISFSCFSLVGLLSTRWYDCGHFPLSNMYESLMFLAWGVTAVTLYFAISESPQGSIAGPTAERAEKQAVTSDIAAVWSSPVAWGIVAFATLSLPKELQKASALVPALQSNWLVMHVSVVMLSYATLMFGSVLCMAVLALSQPKDSPITALREAVVPALRSVATSLSPAQRPAVATSPQVPEMAVSAMTNTLDFEAGNTARGAAPAVSSQQFQVAGSSGGSVTVEFSSAASAPAAQLTEDDKLALTLDDLAYRSLLLGFGFLTIGIVSGAVWANEAWGNYWSWDPKETWALIAWLVYAGYLHVRLQLGWDTRDSAKIGAFGFFVVWLCYVGVNLMGIGLHSYGFFLK